MLRPLVLSLRCIDELSFQVIMTFAQNSILPQDLESQVSRADLDYEEKLGLSVAL